MMKRVGIALGSNLGDKIVNLQRATVLLGANENVLNPFLKGGVYASQPVDCPAEADVFYNSAIEIGWQGSVTELWQLCQTIERELGRPEQRAKNSARTIDLDIIYYGEEVLASSDLQIPHPRALQRDFVLRPLADIRPTYILAGSEQTLTTALAKLDAAIINLITRDW